MTDQAVRPRRFYAVAQARPIETGFGVALDERWLRTPAGAVCVVPSNRLAEAIAEEWGAQGDVIDWSSLALTRLVFLALDRVGAVRSALAAEARAYAQTDLVCYLSDADAALRAKEEAAWAPWRAWAAERLNVRLFAVEGVRPAPQAEASLQAAESRAAAYDDFRLAAFSTALGILGSAVLAFALVEGALDADAALAASRIDEDHQIERWGADAEALATLESRRRDLRAVGALLATIEA